MNSENNNTSDAYRLNTILHRGGNRGIIKPHYQTYGKILRICTKTIYRQIPLIRPYIWTKDKFYGPIFGFSVFGGLISGKRNILICNLLNLLLLLFFFCNN